MSAATETAVRTFELFIPCEPLGANQVKGHWSTYHREKTHTMLDTNLLWWIGKQAMFPQAVVDFEVVFSKPARRDPANYHGSGTCKWIIDALVRAGAFPDDSPQYVEIRKTTVRYERNNSGVTVTIRAREAGQ